MKNLIILLLSTLLFSTAFAHSDQIDIEVINEKIAEIDNLEVELSDLLEQLSDKEFDEAIETLEFSIPVSLALSLTITSSIQYKVNNNKPGKKTIIAILASLAATPSGFNKLSLTGEQLSELRELIHAKKAEIRTEKDALIGLKAVYKYQNR